jgi:deoxyribonuclease-4
MADHPRFGPAGVPFAFKSIKASLEDVPSLLRREGLDAFEYEAIYWGMKPQIKKNDAQSLGKKAKDNDVWVSLHGSYFVNLCGEKRIVEASKKRLIACALAAEWMNAKVVVFHPGFYGNRPKELVLRNCLEALRDLVESLNSLKIKDAKIGPETMGKPSQLGSLEEVLRICEEVEQTQLVIDWSHLHARDMGRFRDAQDFRNVVEIVEDRLGTEAAKNMHCHFTKIEFTDKGERRHHSLEEERYGPSFAMLAGVIAEFKLRPVIISESPMLDIDAMKMRDIVQSML